MRILLLSSVPLTLVRLRKLLLLITLLLVMGSLLVPANVDMRKDKRAKINDRALRHNGRKTLLARKRETRSVALEASSTTSHPLGMGNLPHAVKKSVESIGDMVAFTLVTYEWR